MASAYPTDEENLSTMFTQMDIETDGLISRSQKDKPQLCYLGYSFRKITSLKGKLLGDVVGVSVRLHVVHSEIQSAVNTK